MTAAMGINERQRWVDEHATPDERMWATWIHLSLLAHTVISGLAIIITIVLWMMKKNESAFIADHGREAINFQISLFIYSVVSAVLALIVIGIPMLLFIPVLGLIGLIMGSLAANRGELFRYPVTIRFLNG